MYHSRVLYVHPAQKHVSNIQTLHVRKRILHVWVHYIVHTHTSRSLTSLIGYCCIGLFVVPISYFLNFYINCITYIVMCCTMHERSAQLKNISRIMTDVHTIRTHAGVMKNVVTSQFQISLLLGSFKNATWKNSRRKHSTTYV